MAKSIRSKSKRRMRVIKRERLAPRVLKRLQATVTNLDCSKTNMEFDSSDVAASPNVESVRMEIDSASLNLKTMKKSDGSYPIWLSQRKIKKKKKIERKIKQNAKRMKGRRKC